MILCIRVLYINIYMHYRSKKVGNIGQRKRIRPEDVTQMQYGRLGRATTEITGTNDVLHAYEREASTGVVFRGLVIEIIMINNK